MKEEKEDEDEENDDAVNDLRYLSYSMRQTVPKELPTSSTVDFCGPVEFESTVTSLRPDRALPTSAMKGLPYVT